MSNWSCSDGVSSVFTACLLSPSQVEKQVLSWSRREMTLGEALVVACDVLDTLTHEAGDVIPEVASNLLFVLCFKP